MAPVAGKAEWQQSAFSRKLVVISWQSAVYSKNTEIASA
jgi:hypothetical protein